MAEKYIKNFSWDFYSKLIILIYCLLQILRWPLLPTFMDIYYHLLTAWGFIQAGGYSGWDFWQYAPIGRLHIYPPVLHIILAFFIKLGMNKIILVKLLEAITPTIFLIVLWIFISKNYSERLAFFVLLATSSSFSFFISLLNHIPATLSIIFGFLAFDRLFKYQILRSIILLTLCFYTHIGVSWFFILSFMLYGLFNQEFRKVNMRIFISTLILSFPILFKQWQGLKLISLSGISERYFCEFKTLDYALALLGLYLVFKMPKIYRLFLALFFASFIFLPYPYRFFSAQGFLPIILLSAVALENIFNRLKDRRLYLKFAIFFLGGYILFFSPTVAMEKIQDKIIYKIYLGDSAFVNMILPLHNERTTSRSLWFPVEYLSAAEAIQKNSQDSDIIYSNLHLVGVTLASISERATANALFPEIGASGKFNPFVVSKIVILTKDVPESQLNLFVDKYEFIKIGENKLFNFYKNPHSYTKFSKNKASLPFWLISVIGLIGAFLFWRQKLG